MSNKVKFLLLTKDSIFEGGGEEDRGGEQRRRCAGSAQTRTAGEDLHHSGGSGAPKGHRGGTQGAQGRPHVHQDRSHTGRRVRMRYFSFLI